MSYVELDTSITLCQEQVDYVEKVCNESIAKAIDVRVHVIKENCDDPVPEEVFEVMT